MEIATHPNPQPNPHHRKIDLQSPADLLYLQRNLSAAATQKLNLHFPPKHAYATHIPLGPSDPRPQGEQKDSDTPPPADPMRQRVEELVSAFITHTWAGAKHSISVNGMDAAAVPDHFTPSAAAAAAAEATAGPAETAAVEGVDFQYSPYDPRLSTRVAALYAEVEALTGQVSNLRRARPREGAEGHAAALREAVEADQSLFERSSEEARRPVGGDPLRLRGVPDEAAEMYERGLGGLARLSGLKAGADAGAVGGGEKKASLTETVGKVQRARRVVGELE